MPIVPEVVTKEMKIKLLIDSVFIIASALTSAVGFLFHIIGFCTQYWFKGPLQTHEFVGFSFKAHAGLWRGCDESDTFCFVPTGGNSGKTAAYNTVELQNAHIPLEP